MVDKVYTKDEVRVGVQLLKDGQPFTINPADIVKACFRIFNVRVSPIVNCSSLTDGADWTQSFVVAVFSTTETESLPESIDAQIEIAVFDDAKPSTDGNRWVTGNFNIIKGVI